ncbi:hypothetical protein [Streptomyces sp. LS1784]|uniref:hypothetical protein n=1 Tax=Streptomyces sp. LS1784 TaxID=2851533 RepID=UPI001CC9B339|nr:hypothetical protein [Streptomyces sp. LS1784]
MSTSHVLPVLRTTNRWAAYDAARRLLALAVSPSGIEVRAYAPQLTPVQARPLRAAFPENVGIRGDLGHPEPGEEAAVGPAPFVFSAEERPAGAVEEQFLDVVGTVTAELSWDGFAWPAAPELGLEPRYKDAGLQLLLNNRSLDYDDPAGDHTLFIHFRAGDVERAEWLARQVGLAPIGPVELGW